MWSNSSRRSFLRSASLSAAALCCRAGEEEQEPPLQEFGYSDVTLAPGLAQTQFEETQSVLLSLNEDSLLKPWRLRAGLPAPGPELGGWYDELPLDKTDSGGHGFAPGHSFGQWISALARGYAINHDRATRQKLERTLTLYGQAISGRFYQNFRFPAYNYDKLVIGLIDAHRFADSAQAFSLLERTTDAAEPHLPPRALDRDEPQRQWRAAVGDSTANDYTWDESYTLPENLYLAWKRGAGERYRGLACRFLLDKTYFDPLSENKNVLPHHHAYSFCNALSSAMQAYIADGSSKHLHAAANAFNMIEATQSFATGGWGPNESFVVPDSGELYASLSGTHRGFETPCGSYAHSKLTRYLLRVTRDGRYGDSLERILYNTVLGAKPLQKDGRAFYYSDYHSSAKKAYFPDAWPCCSGTLPQIAADYRILTYFRDAPGGVFVNLYLPSTLRWTNEDGSPLQLTQSGSYPVGSNISMVLRASKRSAFTLHLRVPAWSGIAGSSIRINGEPQAPAIRKGFAAVNRTWKDGDRIDVRFDMSMRLEPIEPAHPETVALIRGPLVLFALGKPPAAVDRQLLLAAKPSSRDDEWLAGIGTSELRFRPFTNIQDEPYSTYLTLRQS